MNEKIRFVPSKRRIWLGFFASCLLVGMGCFMVHKGRTFGWFYIVLFGLGVFAPLLLRKDTSWLELDKEGFTLCQSSRSSRYLWSHINVLDISRGVVSFTLFPERQGGTGQAVARAVSGYDGSIPNIFPLPPESLLELMTKFKLDSKTGA